MEAPANIRAVYDKNKKAVKISWKKVSGAKYYKVYRSTRLNTYNADEEIYLAKGDLIAKEVNEDAVYNEVYYSQYFGITGSISKTSVYDYAKLENGVKYYYYVVAYGEKNTKLQTYVTIGSSQEDGSGKPAIVVYSELPTVTVKNIAKHTVKLSYNKIKGAKKYEIYRSTAKNGEYIKIATTKETSYKDKTVIKGKSFYYKVTAIGTSSLKSDFAITSQVNKIKVTK